MTDDEIIAHMRSRINTVYEYQIGTESWERKRVLAIIDQMKSDASTLRSIQELAAYCLRNNEGYHTTMIKISELVGSERRIG